MELKQYRGPFTKGQRLTVSPQIGHSYVHIGIEIPKSQQNYCPEVECGDEGIINTFTGNYRELHPKLDLKINSKDYAVSMADILEFDMLNEIEWDIQFLDNLPAETIIDLVWN